MNYKISELLDGLEEVGQPLKPRGGSAARVKANTLARIHAAEALTRPVQPVYSRFRPLTAAAAALATALLLCGSVFAAWKLGVFRFTDAFGPEGQILDSYAQTYEPADPQADEIVSAQWKPTDRETDYVPQRVFTTAAETKDFRFSLCSLTANSSVIYAVIDVEGITDWGRTHLDTIPELAVWNHSRQNSGSVIDARLVGSKENLRRYLVGFSGSRPLNEAGDDITFECLELFEEAYPQGHGVYLFDVVLESLAPGAITLEAAGDGTAWRRVCVDSLSLNLEVPASEEIMGYPTVELVFRDGTRETILREGLRSEAELSSEHQAVIADMQGWKDDSAHLNLVLASPLNLKELAEIVVDGVHFPVNP